VSCDARGVEHIFPMPPPPPSGQVVEVGEAGEVGEVGEAGEVGALGEVGEAGEVGALGDMEDILPLGEVGDVGDAGEADEAGGMSDMVAVDHPGPPPHVPYTEVVYLSPDAEEVLEDVGAGTVYIIGRAVTRGLHPKPYILNHKP
jgi:hypothetical protein